MDLLAFVICQDVSYDEFNFRTLHRTLTSLMLDSFPVQVKMSAYVTVAVDADQCETEIELTTCFIDPDGKPLVTNTGIISPPLNHDRRPQATSGIHTLEPLIQGPGDHVIRVTSGEMCLIEVQFPVRYGPDSQRTSPRPGSNSA